MGYFNERRDYIIYSDEKIEATGEEERAVGKGEDLSWGWVFEFIGRDWRGARGGRLE